MVGQTYYAWPAQGLGRQLGWGYAPHITNMRVVGTEYRVNTSMLLPRHILDRSSRDERCGLVGGMISIFASLLYPSQGLAWEVAE